MKITLKNRIARSLEILSDGDFKNCMHSNDIAVVFYASVTTGSKLDARHNKIMMNRNALPLFWYSNPYLSDCVINFSFKKAYAKVVEYLEQGYDITPGRVLKLLDLLSYRQPKYSMVRKDRTNKEILHRYLRNLNNMRMHCGEMTEAEIYDFSFDMMYDFIDKLSLSKETLSMSFLIMYWIQRENRLIPLALTCDKDKFLSALGSISGDRSTERERKKEFRIFMHKVLESHLKEFIKNMSEDSEKPTSRDRILDLIKENPTHTAKTMASCLDLSVQAVQKQIAILKKEKRLTRIGPDKGGQWKVVETSSDKTNAYGHVIRRRSFRNS